MIAGGYSAIVLETQKYSLSTIETRARQLMTTAESIKTQLNKGEVPVVDRDTTIGDWLWLQGLYYFFAQGKILGLAELFNDVKVTKGISEAITSIVPNVTYSFSMPIRFAYAGYGIDVDRNIFSVFSRIGDQKKQKQFMTIAGFISSGLEHNHIETAMMIPAASTVSILNESNKSGIPIYTITKDNLSTILPKLQVSAEVVTDIINAINAGKVVTVPQRNINFYGWVGTGYIVQDPATGAAAYLISGGTNGAFQPLIGCLLDLVSTGLGVGNLATATTTIALSVNDLLSAATTISSSSDAGSEADLTTLVLYSSLVVTVTIISLLAMVNPILSILVNVFLKMTLYALNCSSNFTLQACPPWWCALPCAGFISDWFDGIKILQGFVPNASNPCQ